MLRPRDEIREEDLPSDRVMEALPDRALRQRQSDDVGEVSKALQGQRLRALLGDPRDGGEAVDRLALLRRHRFRLHRRAARVARRNPSVERLPACRADRLVGTKDRIAARTDRLPGLEPADETSAPHNGCTTRDRLKRSFATITR